jgi:very-short-patch-repair endonuclease
MLFHLCAVASLPRSKLVQTARVCLQCGEGPSKARGRGALSYRPDPQSTVSRARELRRSLTRQEVKLWLRLRELKQQGFRFRRQVRIEKWITDFACFATRIIIEVDGMQHGFEENLKRDHVRDNFLKLQGFHIMRFTNDEIWSNIDGVVEQIFLMGKKGIFPLPVHFVNHPPRKGEGRDTKTKSTSP